MRTPVRGYMDIDIDIVPGKVRRAATQVGSEQRRKNTYSA